MTDDEKRAYSRGYNAGRRRLKREREWERSNAEANAQWNRCYLALLPAAMQVAGWTLGDKPVNSTADRLRLAVSWTNQAVTNMRTTR